MASPRLARSLMRLRDECNREYPNRSRLSDGWLGDPAHQARESKHNPNEDGVVTALDVTGGKAAKQGPDEIPHMEFAELIRRNGLAGHRALRNGGYVIHAGRIASARNGWRWRTYTGANSHDTHAHVAASDLAENYDDETPWNVSTLKGTTMTTLEDLHAAIMIDIAEGRADDATLKLIYRHTYEMWSNLINGGVGTGAQNNGTPAYEKRLDMMQDVLNVPSMVRTVEAVVTGLSVDMGTLFDTLGVDGPEPPALPVMRLLANINTSMDAFGEVISSIADERLNQIETEITRLRSAVDNLAGLVTPVVEWIERQELAE